MASGIARFTLGQGAGGERAGEASVRGLVRCARRRDVQTIKQQLKALEGKGAQDGLQKATADDGGRGHARRVRERVSRVTGGAGQWATLKDGRLLPGSYATRLGLI